MRCGPCLGEVLGWDQEQARGLGTPQMRELAHGEAAPPGCWGAKQCQVRRLGAVVPRSVCEVGVG